MGNTKPHKDLPTLFSAFERIAAGDSEIVLLLVGEGDDAYLDAHVAAACRSRVRFTGRVSDPELRALYAGAAAFAFPSRYEGFGLPPLEAMSFGTPVVVARAASLPEVVGDAALMFEPGDADGLASALQAVLERCGPAAAARYRRPCPRIGAHVGEDRRADRRGVPRAPERRSDAMRPWRESTFVFVTTNTKYGPDSVEERWLPVMSELVQLGASVQLLCDAHSPFAENARSLGVAVGPYVLDRWNVIRSRSRLRKYLQRYQPVAVHSTGLEADLLTRWAARVLPDVAVIATLTAGDRQRTRRKRPIDALMRRFDEAGLGTSAAVFVTTEELIGEVQSAHYPAEKIVFDPLDEGASASPAASVARHLEVYRALMAGLGRGS